MGQHGLLEKMTGNPMVTLNRAVIAAMVDGPGTGSSSEPRPRAPPTSANSAITMRHRPTPPRGIATYEAV